MNKTLAIAVGAVLLLLLLIFSTTYSVSFSQVAVRHTFGGATVESVKTEPGLKWKWPIIQDSDTYDTRLHLQETALEEISTADGQQVLVKAFLLWKVDTSSPEATLEFDRAHESMDEANGDLKDPFTTALTGALSEYEFQDLLGAENRLGEAETKVVDALAGLRSRGIVPVKVGISQLILPERTSNSVIRRMEATRARLAEAKRFQGTAYVDGLTAEGRTMADTILTFAALRAATIRAEAESKAAEYLDEMGEEEELAIFLVWLDTLEATLSQQSTFILEHNVAPYHLMSLSAQDGIDAIPQPATVNRPTDPARRLAGEPEPTPEP